MRFLWATLDRLTPVSNHGFIANLYVDSICPLLLHSFVFFLAM